jgi:hypothetical protein
VARPRMHALASAAAAVACASCVAIAAVLSAAPAPSAVPVLAAGARVSDRLPPGLSTPEHAALERAGAYAARPVRLLVVGDSIALTLGIGLARGSQADYGVTISNHATLGCDLDPDTFVRASGKVGVATRGCEDWRALWPGLAAAEHPQVVALGVGRWEALDHYWDGHWVHIGQAVWDAHVAADLRSAVAIFHTFGARVVLLTMPYVDPAGRQPDGLPWSEDSPARARAFNALVERVARADPGEVSVVNVNRMLSPDGVYTASLAGVVVRWMDGIHVTPAGGELLQPEILPEVASLGLQDERGSRVHA